MGSPFDFIEITTPTYHVVIKEKAILLSKKLLLKPVGLNSPINAFFVHFFKWL
jgi:hypothetical protein